MNKSGSCLCGAITYETSGALRPVVACHCSQCRKTSGNYVTATSVARDRITIKGEPVWFASSDTARRGFCGTCGSNLFWDGAGKNISIFAGTIDGESGLKLKGHIFCADKGDYYDITDGLPRADQADADLTTKVE
ncbi:GFA family protein [uncultured Litoreibacter sp.]|uniref:GFA family protein n=1 Tax=uncultured Litoreibacter sp. TaxID=1392394 RepID=UPI00261D4A90|nr:GFA family protein [uncultured Litoreibacter sp.]